MTRSQRLTQLLRFLAPDGKIPDGDEEKWRAFRALLNTHEPCAFPPDFLAVQDALLQGEIAAKGITDWRSLQPVSGGRLYLWQGDITTLQIDAIVNAANSGMTGCYLPLHNCIDNVIHTYAGVQLRYELAQRMARQGHPEPVGTAKITPGYNLPCRYILHTVGPCITGEPGEEDCRLLKSCYTACLSLAGENGLTSVAFCCISTGVFRFPRKKAARIAIGAVTDYLATHPDTRVVFNVFLDEDRAVYEKLFAERR